MAKANCSERLLKAMLNLSDNISLEVIFAGAFGEEEVDYLYEGDIETYEDIMIAGNLMRKYGRTPEEFKANLGEHIRGCRRCKRVYFHYKSSVAERRQKAAAQLLQFPSPELQAIGRVDGGKGFYQLLREVDNFHVLELRERPSVE